jgi:hypothetical protein
MLVEMRASADSSPARYPARAALAGLCGSLLAHALLYVVLHWAGTLPAMDFALQLPNEVEFGLADPSAVHAAALPPETAAPEPAASPAPETGTTLPAQPKPHKPKPKAKAAPDAGVAHEVAEQPHTAPASIGDGKAALSAFAPAGAQIALRVNLARVRDSELAPDVRGLLEDIPDWQLILGGSGLDPLHDLERLYIASPDLKRANLVIAGQYSGDDDLPRRVVASLAEAHGTHAAWHKRGTIAVAAWANADETPRVLALIGPQQFAITRPDDLPRVLAVARALAKRAADAAHAPDSAESDGDALLGLAQDQTLGVSVEGAKLFARGNMKGIPDRLELSVRQSDAGLAVTVEGTYPDADAAVQGRDYWRRVVERYARHPLVALVGMREPLANLVIETDAQRALAHTTVSVQQARVLLGFLRGAVARPAGIAPDAARLRRPDP